MIEGVIVDTISAIVSLYNQDFKYYKDYKYIHPYEIDTWNFTELNCATPEYINTYFNQQRLFDILDFMDNAEDIIYRLAESYNIVIVSMGYSPNLRCKELWIEKNLPYATFIGVNFKEYPDKAHIDMSDGVAFLDDGSKNLDTSNCPNKIIFGDKYVWNIEGDRKYKRCFNWYDVLRLEKEKRWNNV